MRAILVGVAVVAAAVAGPAYGGSIDDAERRPSPAHESVEVDTTVQERGLWHETPPFEEVVVEEYHSAGAEFGMGVASTVLSVFYTPVRLTVGIIGAGLGGVEGWLTGGDIRTARSMWRPTVEGDYYIRPDHLDRTEHYEFSNVRPVVRERYSIRGRHPMAFEEREATVAEAPAPVDYEAVEPAEPELEDSDDR